MTPDKLIIGVLGPCASGKSTLVNALKSKNYIARHIAQEHSYVRDMWKQLSNPDFLIYLDVSFEISIRRTGTSWKREIFRKQVARLEHAREYADLYIQTDELNPQQVLDIVLDSLQ